LPEAASVNKKCRVGKLSRQFNYFRKSRLGADAIVNIMGKEWG
jgi:hypothetical protein